MKRTRSLLWVWPVVLLFCLSGLADFINPDKDTRLNDTPFTNNNYGGSTTFASSDRSHMLMHFEVSVQETEIIAASLRLYRTGGAPTDERTISVYELLSANGDWIEGTSSGFANPGEPTWGHRQFSSNFWAGSAGASTPGVDHNATPIGSITSSSTSGWWEITLTTSVVENWRVNSNQNYGVILIDDGESGSIFFASREDATASIRPQLDYEPIPEPATRTLLAMSAALLLLGARGRFSRRDAEKKTTDLH